MHGLGRTLSDFQWFARIWYYYVIVLLMSTFESLQKLAFQPFSFFLLRGVDFLLEMSFMQYSSSLSLPSQLFITMWNPLSTRFIMGGNHCKCGTCFHTRQHNYKALLVLSLWKYYAVSLRFSVSWFYFRVVLMPTNRPH